LIKETGKFSDPIRIRAHHLLCIQGFQGYGYSSDFERHMKGLVAFLDLKSTYKLQVVAEVDEICSICPHKIGLSCDRDSDSHQGVGKLDAMVILRAGLDENRIYSWKNAKELVNNNLTYHDIMDLCSKCGWNDNCLFYIKKIRS
jgi:uncharacterized protein